MADYPVYRKSMCIHYKVFSSDHCVRVFNTDNEIDIGITCAAMSLEGYWVESNEEEFNTAYSNALNIINNKVL